MKNRSEKKRLDGNSFLLAVTIILFFVMYIVGIIMFGGRGFAKVQNFTFAKQAEYIRTIL